MESHKFKKFYKLFLIRCQLFIKENKLWIQMFIIVNLNCKIISAGSSPGSINIQPKTRRRQIMLLLLRTFSWLSGLGVSGCFSVRVFHLRWKVFIWVHRCTSWPPPSPLHTTFPTPDYHHSQTLGLKQSQLRIVMKSRLN